VHYRGISQGGEPRREERRWL